MENTSLLFIVSAPSGAGKTSLLRETVARVPGLQFSVSCTTRPPRPHEREGVDYHFVSPDDFQRMIGQGQLIEWTEIYGNLYGTPKEPVEEWRSRGIDIIFDIDPEGARQIKKAYEDSITIFVLPPSFEVLEERLRGRGTDEEAVIARRLNKAREEIAQSNWYQHLIVNDDFERAVAKLASIILEERRERKKNKLRW